MAPLEVYCTYVENCIYVVPVSLFYLSSPQSFTWTFSFTIYVMYLYSMAHPPTLYRTGTQHGGLGVNPAVYVRYQLLSFPLYRQKSMYNRYLLQRLRGKSRIVNNNSVFQISRTYLKYRHRECTPFTGDKRSKRFQYLLFQGLEQQRSPGVLSALRFSLKSTICCYKDNNSKEDLSFTLFDSL